MVVKDIAIGAGGLGLYSRAGQIECRRRLATAAAFLRSCVTQMLGPATRYTIRRNTESTIKISFF